MITEASPPPASPSIGGDPAEGTGGGTGGGVTEGVGGEASLPAAKDFGGGGGTNPPGVNGVALGDAESGAVASSSSRASAILAMIAA